MFFFFSSRRRHTRFDCDWSSDVCSSDLPPGPTFSGAVHVAVVEVDPETGRVAIRRYALVEDCGPVINPMIVDGQVHGAVAQGIGEALLERVVYDDGGQLLTGTLMDYALPRADDIPAFEISHLETPSRSEEHTSELQSQSNLVCRLLLEKKKTKLNSHMTNPQ